jgi:molybdopterin-guanine dinucleotide biosynthesis protein A
MGSDKGQLVYAKLSLLEQRLERLQNLIECGLTSYLSCRPSHKPSSELKINLLIDHETLHGGPGAGILSAHLLRPEAAWLVLACDFPFANREAVQELIAQRSTEGLSTVYQHTDGTIEPLFAIWEPETLSSFLNLFHEGKKGPRYALEKMQARRVIPKDPQVLINVNSKQEAEKFL